MSVTLSPSSQLAFQRPLTQLVKRTLAVSNHNSQPIVYKVKTTAPKQYCVRPNSGRIEPGETVEVQVLLQPMKEDPAPGAKCRDKFLVQSVVVTMDRETSSLAELWAAVEKEDKASADKPSLIHEQKIRCAYLPAADDGTNGANGTIQEEESTPSSKFATVRSTSSTGTPPTSTNGNNLAEQSFTSTIATPPSSSSPVAPDSPSPASAHTSPLLEQAQQASIAAGGVVAGAAAAVGLTGVASAVAEKSGAEVPPAAAVTKDLPSGEADLRAELAAARLEIAGLRKQLESAESTAAGLRSRGVGGGEKTPVSSGGAVPGTAQAVVMEKGSEGVPVQIVVGIAVGVFVVTWALF